MAKHIPEPLRRGKKFHDRVQAEWDDKKDTSYKNEKHVLFEYPAPQSGKIRRGRIDIYFDLGDGSACIFEIKATDWDRVKYRRKLLGAHRRQIMKYVDQYLLLHDISVVATVIYPHPPATNDIRAEVEDYFGEWAIQVMWYDDSG